MSLHQEITYTVDDIRFPSWDDIEEEDPLPDEIEAIECANKSIKEHGTIPHDAIGWD